MKRLVTIQDISCFGKCSQTVAMPVISALGIETVILPTAILSTHTGKFKNYTCLSLKDEMTKIIKHWKEQKIEFDAIYVGYIGSSEQIDIICDFIDYFSDDDTLVFVDPAMADNAEIYSGFDLMYVEKIKKLCNKADIITPNIYEAMLMTGRKCTRDYSYEDALCILNDMEKICKNTIITGIHIGEKIITVGKNSKEGKIFKKENKNYSGVFYGTGDVFSSTFIGSYLNGETFEKSIAFADDFVSRCIEETLPVRDKYWYSINFEKCLYLLTDFCRKKDEK